VRLVNSTSVTSSAVTLTVTDPAVRFGVPTTDDPGSTVMFDTCSPGVASSVTVRFPAGTSWASCRTPPARPPTWSAGWPG
jgi:hypothetical protein